MYVECWTCPQRATLAVERVDLEVTKIPQCTWCARGEGKSLPLVGGRMMSIMSVLLWGGAIPTETVFHHAGLGTTRGAAWNSLQKLLKADLVYRLKRDRQQLCYLTPWGVTYMGQTRERPFTIA